jgi:antitoxin component HigA of HigAB toxin-antitoxin module
MKVNINPIKTKKDYYQAISRLEKIFDAKPDTPEGNELEVMGILVDKYELTHFSHRDGLVSLVSIFISPFRTQTVRFCYNSGECRLSNSLSIN